MMNKWWTCWAKWASICYCKADLGAMFGNKSFENMFICFCSCFLWDPKVSELFLHKRLSPHGSFSGNALGIQYSNVRSTSFVGDLHLEWFHACRISKQAAQLIHFLSLQQIAPLKISLVFHACMSHVYFLRIHILLAKDINRLTHNISGLFITVICELIVLPWSLSVFSCY